MKVCTFFGHRDCSESVKDILRETVEDLILRGVSNFYVGNHGNFDKFAIATLREAKTKYPHISYQIVLAYLPADGQRGGYGAAETLFPSGIENVPKRFAISYRNKWMLEQADVVVAYVKHRGGSSAVYVRQAQRAKKQVINIAT